MSNRPTLAVSLGDPAGIGPEIVCAAAARDDVRDACRITVFGDRGVLAAVGFDAGALESGSLPSAIERVVEVTSLAVSSGLPKPGKEAGEGAYRYLDAAARGLATVQQPGIA